MPWQQEALMLYRIPHGTFKKLGALCGGPYMRHPDILGSYSVPLMFGNSPIFPVLTRTSTMEHVCGCRGRLCMLEGAMQVGVDWTADIAAILPNTQTI